MLEVIDVGCRIDGRWALQQIVLRVRDGEVYAVTGPNGGGKSLLLAICATLVRPTTGSIQLAGTDALAAPRAARRLVGYLPEEIGRYPQMTVREDLQFFASAYGLSRTAAREAVTAALEDWDLTPVADVRAGVLGRGSLRRLALARAFLHRPPVLLLDDPTGGLDAEARARLWRRLSEHTENGGSVVLSSYHEADLARADRVGTLVAGRLHPPATASPVATATAADPHGAARTTAWATQ